MVTLTEWGVVGVAVASPVRMAMVNLNALRHYIFNENGEKVDE